MINVDLASRALGYMGVFIALTSFGLLNSYEFLTIPDKQYSPVSVTIKSNDENFQRIENITQDIAKNKQLQTTSDNLIQQTTAIAKNNNTKLDSNNAPKDNKNTYKIQTNDRKIDLNNKTKTNKKEINKVDSKKTNHKEIKNIAKQTNTKNTQKTSVNNNIKTNSNSIAKTNTNNSEQTKDSEQLNKIITSVSNSILDKIKDSLSYPKNAIKRKIQGTVLIEFTVIDGVIRSFRIAKSSGYPILDGAAEKLGNKLIGFNTKATAHELKINVPIQYSLIK